MARLRRFVIERDIPGFGAMSIVEMCGAARASNQAIDKIGTTIQWLHSYVSADKLGPVEKIVITGKIYRRRC